MRTALDFLEDRPLVLALVSGALPYVMLRFYLSQVMHDEARLAEVPGAGFLALLGLVGVATPSVFLVVVLRRLVSERESFRLGALLEVYFSVVVVFAVSYSVLQVGGAGPSFAGMSPVWEFGQGLPAAAHVDRLHDVFGDALYLSVVTMTTVGYGDLAPIGFLAKALTALQGLLGIGFVGLVLGQYFSSCVACSRQEGS